ncbi:endogenous retrovirus group FC1 Env polyprotein-like [Callithrix jacchus]|uniref:endogenous retrovirus group FC1 Env polyprotein-like n=1 Tax=Callithrix jacchus TaxID=9483 RepID=UPI00159EB718|nr:endogenous retrovirus group FC1 Env polyprotein-like [Callithrix jacchus]
MLTRFSNGSLDFNIRDPWHSCWDAGVSASSLVAARLGSGALGYSVTSATQLKDKLCMAIEASAASLASLQQQITSLAQGQCCYYINETGLVEENVSTLYHLQEDLHKKQNVSVSPLNWWQSPKLTWLTPIITPIIIVCLLLMLAPFVLRVLQASMREISRVAINQMLLHPCPTPNQGPKCKASCLAGRLDTPTSALST